MLIENNILLSGTDLIAVTTLTIGLLLLLVGLVVGRQKRDRKREKNV